MGICNSIPIHESVRNEIIEIEHNTTPHQQINYKIKYQKNCPNINQNDRSPIQNIQNV